VAKCWGIGRQAEQILKGDLIMWYNWEKNKLADFLEALLQANPTMEGLDEVIDYCIERGII
jgi:hypothetical protein